MAHTHTHRAHLKVRKHYQLETLPPEPISLQNERTNERYTNRITTPTILIDLVTTIHTIVYMSLSWSLTMIDSLIRNLATVIRSFLPSFIIIVVATTTTWMIVW